MSADLGAGLGGGLGAGLGGGLGAGLDADLRVGLDIGATKVLGVVVATDGTVVTQSRELTVPGADGVLAAATAVLDRLAAALDGALPPRIGIGIPGIVDRDRGAVRHAVNLDLDWEWLPLADLLAERTGATVRVENDLNVAAWGAHVLTGADDLAYLSLGTGLAAGFVLDGVLRRGAHGAAGEIGHVPVVPDGPVCSCGQRGCLELSAAGSALTAAWSAGAWSAGASSVGTSSAGASSAGSSSVGASSAGTSSAGGSSAGTSSAGAWSVGGEASPAERLFALAATGNPDAIAVRDRFAAGVADAIRMLGLAVDPGMIIVGGGVANLGEPLLDAVTAALRAQAMTSPFLAALDLAARVRLIPAEVPVGAIGAAMIADAR